MTNVTTPTVNETLAGLVADATVFAQKLRRFHWDVRGEHFFTLHEKFGALYEEWSEKADDLAERLLALGGRPVATLAGALAASPVKENDQAQDARAMVETTVADLDLVIARLHEAAQAAESAGDRVTADMLTEFVGAQEKHRFLLRAWLG